MLAVLAPFFPLVCVYVSVSMCVCTPFSVSLLRMKVCCSIWMRFIFVCERES